MAWIWPLRRNSTTSPRWRGLFAPDRLTPMCWKCRELESRGRSGVLNRALGALHVHLATPSAHFHALAARSGTFGRPVSILCLIVEKVHIIFAPFCASECQIEVAGVWRELDLPL